MHDLSARSDLARARGVAEHFASRLPCVVGNRSACWAKRIMLLAVQPLLLSLVAPPQLSPVNFWALNSGSDQASHTMDNQKLLDALNDSSEDAQQRFLEATDCESVSVELSEEPDWWTRTSSYDGE